MHQTQPAPEGVSVSASDPARRTTKMWVTPRLVVHGPVESLTRGALLNAADGLGTV